MKDFKESLANINILPAKKRVVVLTLSGLFTAICLTDAPSQLLNSIKILFFLKSIDFSTWFSVVFTLLST